MLDFLKLLPRIREMVQEQAHLLPRADESAAAAVSALGSISEDDWLQLSERVRALPVSHLMATFIEPPISRVPAPRTPGAHTVISVDGSQIPADRHEIAHCFVINVGTVLLPYGSEARVRLDAEPHLYFREEDLLEDTDGGLQPVSSRRISSRRLQSECRALTALIEEAAALGLPAVALMDGTLILWSLEAESAAIRLEVLADFEAMLRRARELRIPVAGYISRTGSSDVVNTLRAWLCGLDQAPCRLRCSAGRSAPPEAPCSALQRVSDRSLFDRILHDQERSALFGSQSKILSLMEAENRIVFFYLDTGKEIARVEIPAWAADDEDLLARVHSVALDQVEKGLGYPRALIEAHEKAVVRAAERAAFFQFVQREMVMQGLPASTTRKSQAKRQRSV